MSQKSPFRLHRSVSRPAKVLVFLMTFAAAGNTFAGKTYDTSKHGHPETGVQRLPEEGRGACAQCHDEHGSRDGVSNGGPFNRALFTVDDETLCYSCHTLESSNMAYPGNVVWADSTHATSPDVWWRGPVPRARTSADAGKCVNCHDPHGADDATGAIPSMVRLREEAQCTGCHNGIAAKDVKTQTAKAYRHPFQWSERHTAAEGKSSLPAQYDDSGVSARRHAECADCHNAHVSRPDIVPAMAPEASQRLFGVSRIRVVNGVAGTRPTYEWRGAEDLFDPREYEVCFKCHSSWTTLPVGKPDLAVLTNPSNPSYHPIQGRGRNVNIDPQAFVSGWSWDSMLYCADCHGSDDALVRGPHGSINAYILKAPVVTTPAFQTASPTDLCFSCHRWEVYGDSKANNATQQASRFNRPNGRGHAFHVGGQDVPCYACHVTHGSTTHPALVATGRNPGMVIYTQTAGGGSCTPTCHNARSYTVNYAR